MKTVHTTITMNTEVLAAFGANLGNGEKTFQDVVKAIRETFGTVQTSSLIRTQAVTTDGSTEPDYWNAVLRFQVSSEWNPIRLLRWLLTLEKSLGRERTGHWAARTVDLDLLFWNDIFLDASPELVLPHPMIPWRDFVLGPACEIAPEWVHPLTGLTLCEMRDMPKAPLIWNSMNPVPESLLQEARENHCAILAKRWVCRNGEETDVFERIKRLIGAT